MDMFFGSYAGDLAIDLGTANTLVSVRGKGIVIREPSVVAIDKNDERILAVGIEAKRMLGRTPGNIVAVRPLKDGVIADFDVTEAMLRYFIDKASEKRYPWTPRPRVVVCVPSGVTSVEKRAVFEATIQAGARQAYLIEEPMAAAIGAGIDIAKPDGHMVVDIGGGTTDIAVISMGGKVRATSVNVAGNTFDDEIVKLLRLKFSVAIGLRTAEELKKEIACCRPGTFADSMEVKGRSLLTGLPQRLTVTTEDLYEAVMPLAEQIAAAAHQVLEKTPPELAGDIYTDGVMLTGGGAMLKGLDEYLAQQLKVRVRVAPDPINCVALGTARCVVIGEELESGFQDATPRLGRR